MPHATFWFTRPFRDWIGQRSLTLHWEGRLTVRDVFQRLAADHPAFRANLSLPNLEQETVDVLAAVIMDGNLLSLGSEIRDGATVDVLLPLTGGCGAARQRLRAWWGPGAPLAVDAATEAVIGFDVLARRSVSRGAAASRQVSFSAGMPQKM